jgi:hypothetical protein
MVIRVGDHVRLLRLEPWIDRVPEESARTFRACAGRVYRVDGIDENGQAEIDVYENGDQSPDYRAHTIYVEPEMLETTTET